MRNLLAQIRAIVQRTHSSSTTVADFAAHLSGRLDALARVQEILMRSADDPVVDLAELVSEEFLRQGILERLNSPELSLLVSRAVAAPLALALHELTTNAIKFGQLEGSDRHVDVSWKALIERPGWAVIEWREEPGIGTTPGRADGFGFELIRGMLPYEIGAVTSIGLTPAGLRCRIEFPTGAPA